MAEHDKYYDLGAAFARWYAWARQRPAITAVAVVLLIAWWGHPWTKAQCLREAAKAPTQQGVFILRAQCEQDFK